MIKAAILILFIIGILIGCSTGGKISGGKLSPAEAWKKIEKGAMLVDVRTPDEYRSGHIEGAKNIPLDQIKSKPEGLGLEPEKEMVLYCRSGHRAGLAEAILEKHGFKKVYNAGGYSGLQSKRPVN